MFANFEVAAGNSKATTPNKILLPSKIRVASLSKEAVANNLTNPANTTIKDIKDTITNIDNKIQENQKNIANDQKQIADNQGKIQDIQSKIANLTMDIMLEGRVMSHLSNTLDIRAKAQKRRDKLIHEQSILASELQKYQAENGKSQNRLSKSQDEMKKSLDEKEKYNKLIDQINGSINSAPESVAYFDRNNESGFEFDIIASAKALYGDGTVFANTVTMVVGISREFTTVINNARSKLEDYERDLRSWTGVLDNDKNALNEERIMLFDKISGIKLEIYKLRELVFRAEQYRLTLLDELRKYLNPDCNEDQCKHPGIDFDKYKGKPDGAPPKLSLKQELYNDLDRINASVDKLNKTTFNRSMAAPRIKINQPIGDVPAPQTPVISADYAKPLN